MARTVRDQARSLRNARAHLSVRATSGSTEDCAAGMVHVAGGTFTMGSDVHYPEEAPARPVAVDDFWIDVGPVTNAQFARFVEATGYVTVAETSPRLEDYPGADPEMLRPGSLVFHEPRRTEPVKAWQDWWHWTFGADWRSPRGPRSLDRCFDDHPVVHVAYPDAQAYAAWAGKALPTEAEWEFAARGGRSSCEYAWGDEITPGGKHMANLWQGAFPLENLCLDGYRFTSPVGAFPPNGYGLHDMIGNVWEWTSDDWSLKRRSSTARSCCSAKSPAAMPGAAPSRRPKVIKGGSHLCAANYCRRYRPPARQPQEIDSSTSHIGFRCVVRLKTNDDQDRAMPG